MEGFLIRNSDCLIDVRLFRFSVSSCVSFQNLCFSVIFLFCLFQLSQCFSVLFSLLFPEGSFLDFVFLATTVPMKF